MKKLLLSFLCMLTLFAASATETTYSFSGDNIYNANPISTSGQSYNLNGKNWTISWTGDPGNSRAGGTPKSVQYGTTRKPLTSLTFSTSAFPGTITEVKVNACLSSSASSQSLAVNVTNANGTTNFTADKSLSSTSFEDYTFSGEAEGTINVVFTGTTGGIKISSISVKYDPDGGIGDTKTPVTLTFSASTASATMGEAFTAPTLTVNPTAAASSVVYESSNTSAASVNSTTGAVTLVGAGTTTITASIPSTDANYTCATPATYTLTVSAASGSGGGNSGSGDIIDKDAFGGTQVTTTSTYKSFTITGASGAIYEGETHLNNNVLNLTDGKTTNYRGIFVTTPPTGCVLKSVTITELASSSGKSRNFKIYASNTPFDITVVPTGTAVKSWTLSSSTGSITDTYTFTDNYKYCAIVSPDGALNVKSITVEWEGDADTPEPPAKTPVTLEFASTAVSCEQGQTPTVPTLTVTPAAAASSVVYESTNTSVATVNPSTGAITLGSATGSTTITASIPADNANYTCASPATYTLTVSAAGGGGNEGGGSGATDATFDFTKPAELSPAVTAPSASGNGTNINNKTFTSGHVSLTLTKNKATTDCFLWKTNSGTELRVYKASSGTGATITIAAETGYKITGISMAINAGAFSVSPGSFRISNKIGTWTAPSGDTPVTSVTFTCTTNAQVPSITVTYEPIAAPTQVAQPTVAISGTPTTESVNGTTYYTNAITLSLGCTTEGVTYHYSTDDGANWTAVEGNSFQLNAPVTTLKVKATKDGLDDSPIAEAGPYRFAPAKPVLTAVKDDATNSYNVTITSATDGATIMYSTDGGETWSTYTGEAVNFTEYGETTVTAKAVKEGYTLTESQTDDVHFTIYNPADVMRFERVDDPAILKADDKVIIVALNYDKAMAPYESGKNNCGSVDITKIDVEEDNYHAIELQPEQNAVEIFTLVQHTEGTDNFWRFAPEYTTVSGFLYAPTVNGTSNNMKVGNPTGNNCNATLNAAADGAMKIVFSDASRNIIRYNTNSPYIFSCYAEGACDPVALYVLTSSKEQVARPTISLPEGIYNEVDITEGVTISCSTEGAMIRYTTDGQDARLYGDPYTPGTVIPIEDCTTVRAYAYMADESMYPSASLIATYHVFTGNKVFTRVTTDDMPYLGVGDEIIIVASDGTSHFAMGTTQITHDGNPCREAVALTTGPDANGNLTLTQNTVQPLVLLSGLDRTANYDWRLYASGTLDQGQPDAVFDGYLYSEGANNSLETVRIDDPNSPDMPNADVTFHTLASTGIGNEYGGVTVEFGATSGQENFPNYMGLHKVSDDHFHFNCYTLDEINAGSDIYHVSIFKAYSTTVSGVPAFSHTNVSEPLDKGTQISLTTRDPNAVIYYTTDGSNPTTESAIYTQPIRLNGSCTIKAFAVSEGMEPSPVAEQTYRVRVTRVFELVDVNTKLEEGDEIIFVNAIAYDPADPKGEIKDNPNGRYYALTDTKLDGKDYYQAAELTPEDTPMGKNHRVALTQIDGETLPMDNNQTSHDHVIVAKLELDGSGSAESAIRPWLLNYGGRYFYSTSGHQLSFVDLPENIEDRAGINVGIDITNGQDYYTTGAEKQMIYNKATAVFSGAEGTFTSMRFNHPTSASDNSYIRFNAYGFSYDNEEDVQHTNTYPVSIYRAIDRIEEPSLTIYPTDVYATKDNGVQTYETEGTAPGRSIFYNPVKIVIKQNLHTSAGATLKYAWSKTVQNAPVASEYTPVAGQQIVIELDGFNARINGGEPGSISTFSNSTNFMQTVIRAMAELGEQNSPSLPREIHFRTVAPGIEPGAVENGRRYLDLVRPETYTVGADIWYTTDGTDPVPGATNAILVDKAPGHVMATIDVPVGSTVKVGAFRPGFEPDITTYTENTYYPGVRAMQLVELTPDGKAALNNTTAKYLTYRTPADFNKYVDAHYYTVDPVYDEDAATGIADIVLTQVAAEDAQAVFADPRKFRWTADYYVFALNGNKFENAITGLQDGWSVTVQDSEGANITAHKTTLTVDQDGEETEIDYYGAILQRHGQLGQNTVTSHLTYTADGGTFPTSSPASFITPAMPRPYGLTYRYETVRDLPEDYMRYGDFEFVTGSSIPGHENEENYLIFPAEQYTLRHFNCVFEFNRPNVSLDIIENYDIVYDIAVVTYSDIDDLQGYYGDPSRESAEPHTYSFVVNDVHPDAAIYPTMFINNVYYVPNGDNDGYSLLEANYGDTESTLYRQSIEARNTVSASAPGLNFEMGYYTNNNGTIDWAIRSHTEVTNPGSKLHGEVLGAPFMYHVEAHYPKAAAGEDDLYYSHSTLVQHDAENCSHASAELDENDPFYLLTIGKNYASATQYPTIYVTPIYFFMRLPEPSIEEESDLEDYTQSFQAPGNAPAVATMPQRVIRRSTGMHDENDPLIIRGSKPGVFSVEEAINNGGNLTGIEEVSAQPESDAIYYDLKGVRVVADRLQNGIYIRIKGNTATKVLVK